MNFDLDPDEIALQKAIRDLCSARFPLERVRGGFDPDGWRALADAGVFALRLPEDQGGVGLGMTQAAIVFEELGRALVPGPVVGTHVARARGATEDVIGVMERGDPVVEDLESLDVIGVLDDEGVWRVYPSEVDAEAVTRPLDPLTPVHRLRDLPKGERIAPGPVAAALRTEAAVLTAAMLVGIAAATTDLAVAYAKEREQFGRRIGSFQAVKHICADMLVRAEVARAAVYAAGATLDDTAAGDPARAAAAAKLLATDAALANGKACVQVHGGMGFTWEVDAHLYLKRAAVLATRFGTSDEHAEAMAACL